MVSLDTLPLSSFIDDQWRPSDKQFAVHNPFDGATLAHVNSVTDQQLSDAVTSSVRGFEVWRTSEPSQRAATLNQWADQVTANKLALARLITLEQGKPLSESLAEIEYGISYLRWFAGEAVRSYGDILPSPTSEQWLMEKHPVGVVAIITPWNFPFAMIARKVSAAIAAGCSVIIKPSELTPLTAIAMVMLTQGLELPSGLINLVIADDAPRLGLFLSQHPDIAKLTFTGSTAVGQHLNVLCAAQCKRVSMELGGNAPFVVFDDADLASAVDGLITSKFRNAGQTCISVNRVLVHDSIHDEFLLKLTSRLKQLCQGDGLSADTDVGPLISNKAHQRLSAQVEQGIAQGAHCYYRGELGDFANNCFPITVLTQVTSDMDINQHELFGPVITVSAFKDEQQAVAQSNGTDHGLAAYVYTASQRRARYCAQHINVGMLGINKTNISSASAPFGGVKQSGFGREGSKVGLDDYQAIKFVAGNNLFM